MQVAFEAPKVHALHDGAGKLELWHDGKRIFGASATNLCVQPDGTHALIVVFPLPNIEIGQTPAQPKLLALVK